MVVENSKDNKKKKWALETPPPSFDHSKYKYLENLDVQGWYDEIRTHADSLGILPEEFKIASPKSIPVIRIDHCNQIPPNKFSRATAYKYITLCFDLRVADPLLIQEAWRLISKKRKFIKFPCPARQRGVKGTENAEFNSSHFNIWRNHQIIPLVDLELWARDEGFEEFSNAQLGAWLFSERYAQPEQQVSVARREWRKAVESLPALLAQIQILKK